MTIDTYFTPLADGDVPVRFQETLGKYRRLAVEISALSLEPAVPASVPLCYRVHEGFTLDHVPEAGPSSFKSFVEDMKWNNARATFTNNPTFNCLAFWVPRFLPRTGSLYMNRWQQVDVLNQFRKKMAFPDYIHGSFTYYRHLSNIPYAELLIGLIFAHYKATGKRVPEGSYWTRTGTEYRSYPGAPVPGGYKNILAVGGFSLEHGLNFKIRSNDEYRGDGVFPVGFETLNS